ncbi:predicted protein [Sclerotinia sclerotiorum 1980 UF-70]|uniref:Uncharacterized protein n=2 Tax=Sclerotinia sclerotiorum (strain ATCC 18683 / 1980 / Ss-1) TaxID=665079 RepID=A7EQK6_SCLS1|nr:predicted protein [Sclerotinia sclerotiorum 1980 UF-70]APA13705.1 hypothetical protein sscle_11g084750 [Sclerotinia sclerotiorum 1980 UF-70]EDN91748.1 predicted protein [Sclerotinia sclerotiorum 1980 UF-70]
MGLNAIMQSTLSGAKDLIPSRLRRSRKPRRSNGFRYVSNGGIISRRRSSRLDDSIFDDSSSDGSVIHRVNPWEEFSGEDFIMCYPPSEDDLSEEETISLKSSLKEDGIIYKARSMEDIPEEETVSHSPSSKEKTVFYKAPSVEDFPEEEIVSHGISANEETIIYGPCEAEENNLPQCQASVQELVAHFETLKEGSSECPVSEVSMESLTHNLPTGKSSTHHVNGLDGHDDSKNSTETIIHNPSETSEVPKVSRRQEYKNKIRRCLSSKSLFSTRETMALLNKLEEESSTHHYDRDDSKDSTETIIHSPLEPSEVPRISRRQEYKNKIRRCLSSKSLSSTQQFIAPSKILKVESFTNNVYQKKKFSSSDYSISIYSQDGIDEIFVSPEEKQLNALQAKLFNQELELKKLRSENSQLHSDPTSKSVSESATVVHNSLENTRISNHERCRSKLRQYVSSTHELMAPLKALHPSNRAEKGHAKRLNKGRLGALDNTTIFFETVPFESTDEAEAPIFYCPRHFSCSCEPHPSCPLGKNKMEEQALPAKEHSGFEVFSADEYDLHIKDLSDEFLGIKSPEQLQPEKSSSKDHTGHVNHLTDDRLGVTGFNPRTGVLDSSEEHKTPRRVHWASTENGWESRPIRSPGSSTGGRRVPRRFGKKKRAVDSEITKEPKCTKVSEPVREPEFAEVAEPANEPECAEVLEPLTNAWGDFLAERKTLGLTVRNKSPNKCITTSTITIGPLDEMIRAGFGSLDGVDD